MGRFLLMIYDDSIPHAKGPTAYLFYYDAKLNSPYKIRAMSL